ncbi:alpha-glucosidase [Micromonospora phaseoli]|uniref:Alpha-glucosidase n=1 Tax=Micromonospora phaseoli TaxID=1144548 RepID=A0A1H6SC15_9ACTN|nr:DUF4259 domain-containing protein [Micromonospora phaseoli]PZW03779.1 uncharacterized protein DUF4259 [Micromonospora phaseoli]GIJ79075.1 hypothetical protein Xph01_35070 [Micromonospora phaseoli]SEI62287.1 alpha-glucosidase [Micromonospora phaseoli]
MGTFGPGPFGSDGALDFLDDVAERPPQQHAAVLRHMFGYVLANRDLLWREFFPDQVVAVAAFVAAALPGGEHLQHRLAQVSDSSAVKLPEPMAGLAACALEALHFVASPGGPWHQGWTTETDRLEAQQTIDNLIAILGAATERVGESGRPVRTSR